MLTFFEQIDKTSDNIQVLFYNLDNTELPDELKHIILKFNSGLRDYEYKLDPKNFSLAQMKTDLEEFQNWVRQKCFLFVLVKNQKPIGFSVVQPLNFFFRDTTAIRVLYVVPQERNHGYGEYFLKRVMSESTQKTGNKNFSIISLINNSGARKLYEKLGFQDFNVTMIKKG